MQVFAAKRTGYINYIFGALVFMVLLSVLFDTLSFALGVAPALIYLIWIYLDTGYKIDNEYLYYRSGFVRGKIKISDIHKVESGRTLWAGTKPAIATNGIVVHFSKYDLMYIAPRDNNKLIQQLKEINPDMEVVKS